MQTTEELLAERGTTHGEYAEHAAVTQGLMDIMGLGRNWDALSPMIKETLHMIAHKIGRIVTGNPHLKDHYDDIAGYAKLISQRLEDKKGILPEYDLVYSAVSVSRRPEDVVWANALEDTAQKQQGVSSGFTVPLYSGTPIVSWADASAAVSELVAQGRNFAWVAEGSPQPPLYEPVQHNGRSVVTPIPNARPTMGGVRFQYLYAEPPKAERLVPRGAPEDPGPGTPEDGGHHARQEEPEPITLDRAPNWVRQKLGEEGVDHLWVNDRSPYDPTKWRLYRSASGESVRRQDLNQMGRWQYLYLRATSKISEQEPPSISLPDGVTLSDDCKFWLSSKYRMPGGWMWDTDEDGGLVWGINNTVRVRPA